MKQLLSLIALYGLCFGMSSCSVQDTTSNTSPSPLPQVTISAQPDPLAEALKYGSQASEKTQSASTEEAWNEVTTLWQQALSSLQAIPVDSENYGKAQEKIATYQANFNYANEQLAKAKEEKLKSLQVSVGGGGVGDHILVFEAKYGIADPKFSADPLAKFQCNEAESVCAISVFVINQIAYGVDIDLTGFNSTRRLSKAKALETIKYALPKDAKKIKEWTIGADTSVISYSSEKMKTIFPEDQGTIIVVMWHDDNRPNSIFLAGVWSGDNP
jgi:hypothetical protein